uniref:General transcription factor IIF subunit 2 n=1 Tax=Timema douglasi TaxID=61478 RepID=A0A7R8VBX5_TIMDO|nr:unnamed protein product [Timema douglasi]
MLTVPKYIANRWDKAPGNIEVGKLKISKTPGTKATVSLTLSESVLCLKEPEEENIPRDHRLDVSTVTRQTLGCILLNVASSDSDSVVPETEKLSLEGRIVQKLECRPYADKTYMHLKLESIRKASQPIRQVQQLDRIVQNFKPVSDHKHNIEYEEKKKAEGKKARDDKDAVLEMLFAAFEKHQYYNLKDLVRITRQPVVNWKQLMMSSDLWSNTSVQISLKYLGNISRIRFDGCMTYLKEILKEVCNYNIKNPYKNTWELKPEYRHYKQPPSDATSTAKTDD